MAAAGRQPFNQLFLSALPTVCSAGLVGTLEQGTGQLFVDAILFFALVAL